jgi:hypothetical protein
MEVIRLVQTENFLKKTSNFIGLIRRMLKMNIMQKFVICTKQGIIWQLKHFKKPGVIPFVASRIKRSLIDVKNILFWPDVYMEQKIQ